MINGVIKMESIASIEKLRLKFPGVGSLLFKDLSLSFNKGEKVLILGPSGSGKSTLLQVLTGIIPNSVDVPLKAESMELPESWGYVFQDPDTQFCMPYVDEEIAFVLENLQVPRKKMKEMIVQYLNKVGLHFPDLHTKIQTLSGGMKQRLALASVLALEPEVLILDEPTAMLDPEGTVEVWNTIKNISEDKTLIIVEHKIEHIIELVDRVVLFDLEGKIVADGSKDFVFTNYKNELIEHGIWYPGVWSDYINQVGKEPENQLDYTNKEQQPLISLKNYRGYRGKEAKIQVESTDVYPGEWIGVIGENGAGKSTLLLSMMQLIKTSGEETINGKQVDKKNLKQDMTFVFQNPEFQFVTNSVYDEIAYSLRLDKVKDSVIQKRVEELLELFKLTTHQEQHPYQLSMGQKRRLSVAAAIVNEQPILLLDEPTFGQDAKNTFSILEQLEDWRQKGTTIIMVTHDMNIIEHFVTRVWEIQDGVLISDNDRDEYLIQNNLEASLT
jgi:energy-coupling factor transport system ATP-binding protein